MMWVGVTVVIVLIISMYLFYPNLSKPPTLQTKPDLTHQSPATQTVDFQAKFMIITDHITRNFSATKYHSQSSDVYISADDPTILHVKKSGITWSDFFKTLPMTLTKDCLTTGDGEKLCNDKGVLLFYLNDIEDPNLLDKEIKEGDVFKVNYSSDKK